MPDLMPLVIDWVLRDPSKEIAAAALFGLAMLALFNIDCRAGLDEASDSGDRVGD